MGRLIKTGLLLTFLICYLDWGHDGAEFIGQTEYTTVTNIDYLIQSLLNPFFIIAFTGQLIVLISIFLTKDSRRLTLLGLILLGIIVLLVFILGLLTTNLKVIISTIPFMTVATLYVLKGQSRNKESMELD